MDNLLFYDEEYSLGEYTFGFEFEAYTDTTQERDEFGHWALRFWKQNADKTIQGTGEWNDDSSIMGEGTSESDCNECGGDGQWVCDYCNGTGDTESNCPECEGSATLSCSKCNGEGTEDCETCDGTGKDADGQMDLFGGTAECKDCKGSGKQDCYYCKGSGEEECEYCADQRDPGTIVEECRDCEGTGRYNCEYCGGNGVYEDDRAPSIEFEGPILNATPKNLLLSIKFLDGAVNDYGMNTNESCALHVHLGLPDPKNLGAQMFWVLCHIASPTSGEGNFENKFEELSSFRGFNFVNHSYAKPHHLNAINDTLLNIESILNDQLRQYKDIKKDSEEYNELKDDLFKRHLSDFYVNDKFNFIRMHNGHNTLEWRGPRQFLDEKGRDDIKEFFVVKLRDFIKWIDKIVDEPELKLGDHVYTKEEFFEYFKQPYMKMKGVIRDKNQKHDTRFASHIDFSLVKKLFDKFPQLGAAKFQNASIGFSNNDDETPLLSDANLRGGTFRNIKFGKGSSTGAWNDNPKFIECDFLDGNYFSAGEFTKSILNNCIVSGGKYESCTLINNEVSAQNGTLILDGCFIKDSQLNVDVDNIKNCNLNNVDVKFTSAHYYGNFPNITGNSDIVLKPLYKKVILSGLSGDVLSNSLSGDVDVDDSFPDMEDGETGADYFRRLHKIQFQKDQDGEDVE